MCDAILFASQEGSVHLCPFMCLSAACTY